MADLVLPLNASSGAEVRVQGPFPLDPGDFALFMTLLDVMKPALVKTPLPPADRHGTEQETGHE